MIKNDIKQNISILSLIDDLFKETGFIASIKIEIPRAYTKNVLSVLSDHSELLREHDLSWKVEEIKKDGVVLELDRTNYPTWKRKNNGGC